MLHVIVILAAFWTNIFFIAVKLVDASVHRLHDDEITRNLKLGLPHEQTERIMLKIGCAPREQKRDHLRFGCQKFMFGDDHRWLPPAAPRTQRFWYATTATRHLL